MRTEFERAQILAKCNGNADLRCPVCSQRRAATNCGGGYDRSALQRRICSMWCSSATIRNCPSSVIRCPSSAIRIGCPSEGKQACFKDARVQWCYRIIERTALCTSSKITECQCMARWRRKFKVITGFIVMNQTAFEEPKAHDLFVSHSLAHKVW